MMLNPVLAPSTNPSGAIIGYKNLLTTSTTTDAIKALVPNTWERWRPPAGATTVKFQLAVATDVNFIGIAGHNLSGETFTISTATTIGGALVAVETLAPIDNSAIMLNFDTRTVAEVIFTSTLSAINEIAVVYAGLSLIMPVNIYGGHSPIDLSGVTEFQSRESESGQFLGRNIIKKGLANSFSWNHIEPDWYREYFNPFVISARTSPFFIKWRPDFYEATAFGWTSKDIVPQNMGGGHKLMSVDFSLKAHADL